MIFLLWCVIGGFLLHFLECNWLDMLIKPNYEKPVDTANDIIDRGLSIITYPGRASMVEALKNSPSKVTRELAEKMVVPKVKTKVLEGNGNAHYDTFSIISFSAFCAQI